MMGNHDKKQVSYSIGLDIGTNSVGWAVTDGRYHLLKKGSQHLWGADLFEEAMPAKDRRMHRSARRRYTRRKRRLILLQELMAETVSSVDPYFFKRLELSYLNQEDREQEPLMEHNTSILFSDNFNEKEYHTLYPTIYHLRYHLCNSDEKMDPRLIYMALHHIIKYRGNFLYQGQKLELNDSSQIEDKLKQVFEFFDEKNGTCYANIDVGKFIGIAKEHNRSLSDIKSALLSLYQGNAEETKVYKELVLAMVGYKFDAQKLFDIEEKTKLSFRDANIDEELDALASEAEEASEIVQMMQAIYSYLILVKMITVEAGCTSGKYSRSMILLYEKHKKDLKILKKLYREIGADAYKKMFRDKNVPNTYWSYVNRPKDAKIDDFYAEIRKTVQAHQSLENAEYILNEIENQTFLPKQNSLENGVVPYQINEGELIEILDHQRKYYPEIDRNAEHIKDILTFRIPYYVGPLTPKSKGGSFSWIVKKDESGVIRPWNFDSVVDVDATAAEFINRMRNHCTYILGENTLPKNSLLESEFEVLNELNKICLDGEPFDQKVKEGIIRDLFLSSNEVTEEKLRKYLINHQIMKENESHELTGFQKEGKFSTSLKPWRDFMEIYGSEFDSRKKEIEQIIEYLTIYNEKDIIRRRIRNDGYKLTEEQINRILNKKYSGYGRLSRKLLDGILGKDPEGNPATVIEVMRSTHMNLMQVINNSKLGFKDEINELNKEDLSGGVSYDMVSDLAASPALKRGVWQSIQVVHDIVNYMKHDPENVFIEFAREEKKKGKRIDSRLKKLQRIYDKICQDRIPLDGQPLEKSDDIYRELRNADEDMNDRLYLYYIQHGRSMYSGRPLNITQLDSYEIDHILPQSYVKDDSFDNRVLVLKEENQMKSGDLLLKHEVIQRMRPYWMSLEKCGLITSRKFDNLTRLSIPEKERIGFISRQLVETRQICVHVADFLNSEYQNTKIVVTKAGMSSEFREKYDLYKCRSLNDVHHAHDAYLACMLGAFMIGKYPYLLSASAFDCYSKLSGDILKNIEEDKKKARVHNGWIVRQLNDMPVMDTKTGEVLWNGKEEIEYIKKIFYYKDYFMNYMSRDYDGQLYNATVYSPLDKDMKKKGDLEAVSLKKNRDFRKYGGYSSIKVSRGIAVEYKKGKKLIRTVLPVPAYISTEEQKQQYLERVCETDNVTILRDSIRLGQEFIQDGCRYLMQSPSEWKCVEQAFLNEKDLRTLFLIEKGKVTADDQLIQLFHSLISVIKSKYPLLSDKASKMKEIDFAGLDNKDKEKVISLMLLGMGGTSADLNVSTFKISSSFGRLNNRKIDLKDVEFIFTSPSGIYSSRLTL